MGGSNPTAPTAPAPASSTMQLNGQNVATNNGGVTNVTATPYQNYMMQYAQNNGINALNSTGELSPAQMQSAQQSANANYANGLQTLNTNYGNQNTANMNNIAGRFGGLNTSMLSDQNQNNNLNYNMGLSNLSNQYIGNMQQYQNQDLANNLNYYNAINNGYGNTLGQLNTAGNNAMNSTNNQNNFNNQQYQTQAGIYGTQTGQGNQMQQFAMQMGNAIGSPQAGQTAANMWGGNAVQPGSASGGS